MININICVDKIVRKFVSKLIKQYLFNDILTFLGCDYRDA